MRRTWLSGYPWLVAALLALPCAIFGEEQGLPAVIKLGQGVRAKHSLPIDFPNTAPPDFSVQLRPVFRFDFDWRKQNLGLEWESIRLPVELTNTSEAPLYYYGQVEAQPRVRQFRRQNAMRKWQDITFYGCGVGVCLRELPPGQSLTFNEIIDVDDAAGEVYLEVSLYTSTKGDTGPIVIQSPVKACR